MNGLFLNHIGNNITNSLLILIIIILFRNTIPYAQPAQNKPLDTNPFTSNKKILVCGDYKAAPTLNGALQSGRLVAEKVLENMGAAVQPKQINTDDSAVNPNPVLMNFLNPNPSSSSSSSSSPSTTTTTTSDNSKELNFLEANPYWDQSKIPLQTFKAKEPLVGKIISVKRIVGAQATGETCNIIIDHYGKMPYWEGQSYGVIPPGINPKNGKPHTNRLY